ncbi:hypothetical protein Bca101_076108 [Brassica carinata]
MTNGTSCVCWRKATLDKKSRISWLQEGDLNTTYFHRVCQARACFNAIRSFLLASDRLTSGFYKAVWSIIGEEVINSINHFFYSVFLPATTDSTILSLVPKFPRASRIVDYRPIACLNTIYKVISRLLVARLKPILPDLILPNKIAFVKNRLLVENTVLASELVNGYHKDKGKKKACLCTTNYTLGYNGTVNGYFKGRRGLRQGDPLSPYLFVIAMNCLSLMLNKMATDGYVEYHHNYRKIKLTHLSFADDLLIFIECSIESVQAYHGVLLCTKKLTLANCEPLLQQVKVCFSSWPAKALSFAGRLLLIKIVISGITTFWCSCFILPKACINKINSLCGLFLWNGETEGHHSVRVAWDRLTLTKEQGGLGVKDLLVWNRACSLELVWLLFFRASSVWVSYFKEIVLKGNISNFCIIKTSSSYSWLMNKLIKTRDLCYPLIKRQLGNGISTSFWFDNWPTYGCLNVYLNGDVSRLGIRKTATLSTIYSDGNWSLPLARTKELLEVQIHLTTVTLSKEEDSYEWVINGKSRDKFSIGSVYAYPKGDVAIVAWSSLVWSSYGIPRQNFLTWLVIQNRCPTKDRLLSWGLQVDPLCPLCNVGQESRNHLFFDCSFSFQICSVIAARCGFQARPNWDETVISLQNFRENKNLRRVFLLAWQSSIYSIWKERNM